MNRHLDLTCQLIGRRLSGEGNGIIGVVDTDGFISVGFIPCKRRKSEGHGYGAGQSFPCRYFRQCHPEPVFIPLDSIAGSIGRAAQYNSLGQLYIYRVNHFFRGIDVTTL